MRTISTLLTAVVLGTCGAAMAQAQPEPVSQVASAAPGKSRAEVLADLEMFQRAGLSLLPAPVGYLETEQTPEYRQAYAEYQRLLAGPAYTAAVAKYEAARQSRLAAR